MRVAYKRGGLYPRGAYDRRGLYPRGAYKRRGLYPRGAYNRNGKRALKQALPVLIKIRFALTGI